MNCHFHGGLVDETLWGALLAKGQPGGLFWCDAGKHYVGVLAPAPHRRLGLQQALMSAPSVALAVIGWVMGNTHNFRGAGRFFH